MHLLFQVLIAACVLLTAAAQSGNLLTSCVASGSFNSNKDYFPNKVAPVASKFWDIKYYKTYKILRNEIAGESYVLYQCGTTPPASEANKGHTHFIPVPLRNGIALSSTTLIPYIELLGRRRSIKAWLGSSDYISSACLKKMIASGATTVVKDTSKPANVNALKTKFGNNIVSFHNYRSGYQSSLFNVTDSSYTEATNEAIYEWIKFFAAFFNEEKKANTLVFSSQQRYRCYAKVSKDIVDATDGGVKPKLLWASYTNYNGVDGWDVAECPNYYCEYANLCSADLINSRAGTIDYFGKKLFTTKAFVALAKNAPHWIYPSSNWDEAYGKYKTELDTFVSVKKKQVFDTTGSGENAWFENRLAEDGTSNMSIDASAQYKIHLTPCLSFPPLCFFLKFSKMLCWKTFAQWLELRIRCTSASSCATFSRKALAKQPPHVPILRHHSSRAPRRVASTLSPRVKFASPVRMLSNWREECPSL